MKYGFNGLVKGIVGLILFLAALAEIASYLETSTQWPGVVAMLSAIASPETLTFVYRLLFLFATGVGLWWLSKQLQEVRENWNEIEQRLQKLEGAKEQYVALKENQVVYPSSKNGVLWEWSSGTLIGPSCPTHRVLLLYDPVHGTSGRTASFKDDDYLSSNANFVCPIDDEEFIFIRLAGMKVGSLRTLALAQFQAEQERRRITEK